MMTAERWQRIKTCLEGALATAPEQRAGYLDRHCGDEADLRAEVESLLAVAEQNTNLLHQYQIVHRDIKPNNILLSSTGTPKLVDFGIAKALAGDDAALRTILTQPGLPLFTPEYASPEQLRQGEVTAQSDIYSLGVVLYELLTGSRPFDSRGKSATAFERQVSEEAPPAPSLRIKRLQTQPAVQSTRTSAQEQRTRLDGVAEPIPPALDAIVMQALAKEPAQRYVSAADFADDLSRFLAGESVHARRYRAPGFWRRQHQRRPGLVRFALFAMFVLVSSAMVLAYWFGRPVPWVTLTIAPELAHLQAGASHEISGRLLVDNVAISGTEINVRTRWAKCWRVATGVYRSARQF